MQSRSAIGLPALPAGNWHVLSDAPGSWLIVGKGEEVVLLGVKSEVAAQVERQASTWLLGWLPRPLGPLEDLQVVAVRSWGDKWSAVFRRTVNGTPVLGDRISATFGPGGRPYALALRINGCQGIAPGAFPAYTHALTAARAFLNALGIKEERDLGCIYIASSGDELPELVPARQVEIRCEEPLGRWVATVSESGEVLALSDRIRQGTVAGIVRAEADDFSYCDGVVQLPAAALELTVDDGSPATVVTLPNGSFSATVDDGSDVTLTAQLHGPYAAIDLYGSSGDAFMSLDTAAGFWHLLHWDDSNSRQDERDAWVHVNRSHDVLLEIDPDFTDMDFAITTYVGRQDGYCPGNAWYDYYTLNFCEGTADFANTATIGSIIYHEYCHAITDQIYGPLDPDLDINEASSDFYSNLITGESRIAQGFFQDQCVMGVRDSDNELVYPDDWTGHNHDSGSILAGVFWDAWQEFELQMTSAEAKDLIAGLWHGSRLLGLPLTILEHVVCLFVADDDNGDLTDGTPHWPELYSAAQGHGFAAPPITYGIEIVHDALAHGLAQPAGFDITATISSSGDPIDPASPRLWYDAGSGWQESPLVAAGGDLFTGSLPSADCEGTICYYFYAADVAGHGVTLPADAPAAAFCFEILGNVQVYGDDFETESGWTAGAPDDDATSGFWEWADPELVDGAGVVSQPEDDFTPDPGHLCFVTGAALGSGPGSYDVDGGQTSLISPLYDLTGVESAVVEFQAWIFSGYNTSDLEPLSLWASTDGGGSWTQIFSETRLGGWEQFAIALGDTVPLTDQMRFKFIIQDPWPPVLVEAVVDEFHIYGCADLDSEPPTVSLLSPRGDVYLYIGASLPIRWQASDNVGLADVSLLLSRDYGVTWDDTLMWRRDYSSMTRWMATGPATKKGRLRVIVRDEMGNEGEAFSSGAINIIEAMPGKDDLPDVVRTALLGVSPNPFNPSTSISFQLAEPGRARLGIYDLTGRLVRRLADGPFPVGQHSLTWDGRSDNGDRVGSGIYLVSFRAGDVLSSSKLTLLK